MTVLELREENRKGLKKIMIFNLIHFIGKNYFSLGRITKLRNISSGF